MSLFRKSKDINEELIQFQNTKNAILLDVRSKEEYEMSHIPESINIGLTDIEKVNEIIKDKKFYPDILCENVILYLNDLIIENILLKNSSFILNQGIINDIIVKNELYINNIDEQLINEISPYFISDNINNTKIKRLTLK